MKLKHFHDFEGDSNYPLPYVLVYRGRESELMDIGMHCRFYCKDIYVAGEMQQSERDVWLQSFHFAKKSDAMFCKLRHDV